MVEHSLQVASIKKAEPIKKDKYFCLLVTDGSFMIAFFEEQRTEVGAEAEGVFKTLVVWVIFLPLLIYKERGKEIKENSFKRAIFLSPSAGTI